MKFEYVLIEEYPPLSWFLILDKYGKVQVYHGKNAKNINNVFKFQGELYPGTSLNEYRLSKSFVYLPIPLIYGEEWEQIVNISNNDEMKCYSLNNNYDRPIPRKLAEENNIERTDFGVEKIGAGINFKYDNKKRLKRRLSNNSYNKFMKFYKENKSSSFKHVLKVIKFLIQSRKIYYNYILSKLNMPTFNIDNKELISSPFLPRYLFYWAVIEKQKKYKTNIDKWWLNEHINT